MLERPTALRQAAGARDLRRRFATRAQAIALFGAALIAPVLHGLIERDLRGAAPALPDALRDRRRRRRARAARDRRRAAGRRSPSSAPTGPRPAATTRSEVAHYLLWHVAELDLYLGVIGVAALIAMWLAPRTLTPAARAFVAATLPITLLLVAEVAVFASRQSARIEERNDFYVAPFAMIALLGLVSRDAVVPASRPRSRDRGRSPASLPLAVPFARFVNTSAVSDTLGLLPWWWLQDRGSTSGRCGSWRSRVGLARRCDVRLRPAPLRARSAGAARRLLRACVDRGRERPARDPRGVGRRALRRHPRSPPRLDRPARSAVTPTCRSSGTARRDAAALEQRVLQPQRARRLHGRRPGSR